MALIGGNMLLLLWSLLLIPVVYAICRVVMFLVDVRRRGQAVDKFPSDPKHWLWGHVHLYPGPNEAGLSFQRSQVLKFPRCQAVWIGNLIRPSLLLQHFDTIKVILKTSEPKPMGLGVYGYGRPWLGDGLLVSGGSKWARNRRLLTPAFHFDILKPYIKIKNEATELFLNKLSRFAETGQSFEFFGNISLLTFDIILRCACSYDNDVQVKGESHPYVQAVAALGDLWVKRTLQPWLHFDFLYNLTKDSRDYRRYCNYVHSISAEVIQKRKQTLETNGGLLRKDRYRDFLDVLLMAKDEDGNGLTDQEIRDEVDTFLFEGHDTTASSISWVLFSLAGHPEIQRRCQQEIDSIIDDGQHSDDTVEWEDLSKLTYLTMCIKESMRLHCPVPFIQRRIENEITIDGITLPKRSVIDVNIYNLHHNPAVWEEPMEFRPERFLPENLEKMDNYAFLPFSAGPRNCIGQHFAMHEQKTVVARVLRKYSIELDPNFKVEKKIGLVMKTDKGMYMKAIPRASG